MIGRNEAMTDGEINDIVTGILRDRLNQFGFAGARVRSEIDFDGTPIIRVIGRYEHGRVPTDQYIDSLDAIRTDRPYRPAQTFAAARVEIMKFGGTQFDPKVVDIFVAMPDSLWADLRREISSQLFRFAYPQRTANATV